MVKGTYDMHFIVLWPKQFVILVIYNKNISVVFRIILRCLGIKLNCMFYKSILKCFPYKKTPLLQ
jgi:hypothetical protein